MINKVIFSTPFNLKLEPHFLKEKHELLTSIISCDIFLKGIADKNQIKNETNCCIQESKLVSFYRPSFDEIVEKFLNDGYGLGYRTECAE